MDHITANVVISNLPYALAIKSSVLCKDFQKMVIEDIRHRDRIQCIVESLPILRRPKKIECIDHLSDDAAWKVFEALTKKQRCVMPAPFRSSLISAVDDASQEYNPWPSWNLQLVEMDDIWYASAPPPPVLVYDIGDDLKLYIELHKKIAEYCKCKRTSEWSLEYCHFLHIDVTKRNIKRSDGFIMMSEDVFEDTKEDVDYLKYLCEEYIDIPSITIHDMLKRIV